MACPHSTRAGIPGRPLVQGMRVGLAAEANGPTRNSSNGISHAGLASTSPAPASLVANDALNIKGQCPAAGVPVVSEARFMEASVPSSGRQREDFNGRRSRLKAAALKRRAERHEKSCRGTPTLPACRPSVLLPGWTADNGAQRRGGVIDGAIPAPLIPSYFVTGPIGLCFALRRACDRHGLARLVCRLRRAADCHGGPLPRWPELSSPAHRVLVVVQHGHVKPDTASA